MYQKLSSFGLSVPCATRNKLISLALESDSTWQLDPYMSSTPTFLDNFIVLENLRKRVNEQIPGDVEIFWVMGTDNYYYGMDPKFLIENDISLVVVENRDS